MKVEVQYVIKLKDNINQFGRKCWIGRDEEYNLTFSTIYVTEETACNTISEEELQYLYSKSSETGRFIITKVIQ